MEEVRVEGEADHPRTVHEIIRGTFWKPQLQAIANFEEVTEVVLYDEQNETRVCDVKPMRVNMCCGSGKSRLMNTITLKFDRSCVFFPNVSLIWQYVNGEIYGGTMNPEPGKTVYPEWIDRERKILVVCSQGFERELTDVQRAVLDRHDMNDHEFDFTVTTDETEVYRWLRNVMMEKHRCCILSTYQSSKKVKYAVDRLVTRHKGMLRREDGGITTVFGISCFDEAHTVCSPTRKYLYLVDQEYEDANDVDDPMEMSQSSDEEGEPEPRVQPDEEMDGANDASEQSDASEVSEYDVNEDDGSDERDAAEVWQNLRYMGYRYYTTATYSLKMRRDIAFFGQELLHYNHAQGVADGVIRDFNTHIHMHRLTKQREVEEDGVAVDQKLETAIKYGASAMIDDRRCRVLFYHRYSNATEASGTSAKVAATSLYKERFVKHLGVPAEKVWVEAVTGDMTATARADVFNEFQTPPTDGIYRILVSCRVISMGIDLRCVDMEVFVDPRHTYVEITQNISRSIRINMYDQRPSLIMLPVGIEEEELIDSTPEDRDVAIKQVLKKTCFEKLAKFVHALKEMDPRWRQILVDDATATEVEPQGGPKKGSDGGDGQEKQNDDDDKRLLITIDPNLSWDVAPEDIIAETKSTLRLICESFDEEAPAQVVIDIDARLAFTKERYPNMFPSARFDKTKFPDGQAFCGMWVSKLKECKRAWIHKGLVPSKKGYREAIEKLDATKDYKPWVEFVEVEQQELEAGKAISDDWKGLSDEERGRKRAEFIQSVYPRMLPSGRISKLFPDARHRVGSWFKCVKDAKTMMVHGRTNEEISQHDERYDICVITAIETFDDSDYTAWHLWLKEAEDIPMPQKKKKRESNAKMLAKQLKDQEVQQRIDFLKENFADVLPAQNDAKCFVGTEILCGEWIHHAQSNKTEHMRKELKNQARGSNGKISVYTYLDASDYKPWHDWCETAKERAIAKHQQIGVSRKNAAAARVTYLRKHYPNMVVPVKDKHKHYFKDVIGRACVYTWFVTLKKSKKFQLQGKKIPEGDKHAIDVLDAYGWKQWDDYVAGKKEEVTTTMTTTTKKGRKRNVISDDDDIDDFIDDDDLDEDDMMDDDDDDDDLLDDVDFDELDDDVGSEADDSKGKEEVGRPRRPHHQTRSRTRVTRREKRQVEEEQNEDEEQPDISHKKARPEQTCAHKWSFFYEDDTHLHKKCDMCGRKTSESRFHSQAGYRATNVEKKDEINTWLSNYANYVAGKAVILDAKGLKTSNSVHNRFDASDIIIPEMSDETFTLNSQDVIFGACLRKGDYLSHLKETMDNGHIVSLIYADFTSRYETHTRPLFDYLETAKTKLPAGALVGVTWCNVGAGTLTERSRIERDIAIFMYTNGFEPIEDIAVSESGYGTKGNMNVQFMIKK